MTRRTPFFNENWFQQWDGNKAKLADGTLNRYGLVNQGDYNPYNFEYFVICRLRDTFEGELR